MSDRNFGLANSHRNAAAKTEVTQKAVGALRHETPTSRLALASRAMTAAKSDAQSSGEISINLALETA
jgi:hypothetical protein